MMQWTRSTTASPVDAPLQPGSNGNRGAFSKDLNRMLTAAVVSRGFRNLLLTDPQAALRAGYNDESFHLSESERDAILAIHPTDLRDFAAQLEAQIADGSSKELESYDPHPARRMESAPGVPYYT